jgi:hypothetical protein
MSTRRRAEDIGQLDVNDDGAVPAVESSSTWAAVKSSAATVGRIAFAKMTQGHEEAVMCVAQLGPFLITCDAAGVLKVWRTNGSVLRTWRLRRSLDHHNSHVAIFSLACSLSAGVISVGLADGTVTTYGVGGKWQHTACTMAEHVGPVTALAIVTLV